MSSPSTETSLWLHTAAAIAVVIGSVWLHLRWHPLRRELSEGWDFVTGLPWLIVVHAVLLLLARLNGSEIMLGRLDPVDLASWHDIAAPLLLQSLLEVALLHHWLLPGWPLAFTLPAVLSVLTWRVMRFPYRYGPRRQRPIERWLLLAATIISWTWLFMEVARLFRPVSEWLEALILGQRLVFEAMTAAFGQMVLLRLTVLWLEPEQPEDQKDLRLAFEQTFARWRGIAWLALLDLLILLMQSYGGSSGPWLLLEVTLVFLALPAAVARVPGPIARQGMAALNSWRRALVPLLGILITSLFLLALVRYASATMLTLTGPDTWQRSVLLPVHALVLATVRNWVFLASVLTLFRHGLPPSSARGYPAS